MLSGNAGILGAGVHDGATLLAAFCGFIAQITANVKAMLRGTVN